MINSCIADPEGTQVASDGAAQSSIVRSRNKITGPPKAMLALLCYFLICLLILVAPQGGSYGGIEAMIQKHQRLHALSSPKMILLGGSNVSTGVDSELIQERFGRKVVNMGLGASLGLRYMIEEVKEEIKPGDIIVMMPEYDYFCESKSAETNARLNGSSDLLWTVQRFPSSLKWIVGTFTSSPSAVYDGVGSLTQFLRAKVKMLAAIAQKLADHKFNMSLSQLLFSKGTIYTQKSNYNSCGDFIGHLNLPSPGFGSSVLLPYEPYRFCTEAEEVLSNFGKESTERGATVVLIPPPRPEHQEFAYKCDDIFKHWQLSKNVFVLGSPQRYTFQEKMFFDTYYHLNANGRRIRTGRIIEDLSRFF